MSEETECQAEEKNDGGEKRITAKGTSKFFKYFCGVGLVATMFLFWIGLLPNATIWEAGLGWTIVYGLGAGTIDLNILLDKVLGARQ